MATVIATTNSIRISPRKLRMVATAVKGQNALVALDGLKYLNRKASVIVFKTLKSAVSNAVNNNNLDAEKLVVSQVNVGPATTYKRVKLEAKGRVRRILKRNSHLTIAVTDGSNAKAEDKKSTSAKATVDQSSKAAANKSEASSQESVEEAEVTTKKPVAKKAAAKKPTKPKTVKK